MESNNKPPYRHWHTVCAGCGKVTLARPCRVPGESWRSFRVVRGLMNNVGRVDSRYISPVSMAARIVRLFVL